ncbi:MAG TPA: sodium:solute symporter family protein [Planctomycetes bacterium]|nr:sodium:solute symporter family protein [Planctomycetaceae bacterium]HIM30721.1 sodium:solute symporter family protein [Planctomycetota bacterium]
MDLALPFSTAELAFIGVYLLSLIALGYFGMRARQEDSLRDFYLAGRGVGMMVLLLTLYSTQYSGNTLFGFSSKAYDIGFRWLVCVHFMTAIVMVYLLLAPRLYAIARRRQFITPADYLMHRYGSRTLASLASLLMIFAAANFLIAQLKALGSALEGFAPESPAQAYFIGVISLALIIVIYESLGGFRSVAWTDAIQGSVLMIGFVVLLVIVLRRFGPLSEITQILAAEAPEKLAPPSADEVREWISWILIVGIGGALYPQAIQRIFAARSAKVLRTSLSIMAFLPLTTTLIAVLFGVTAAARLGAGIDGDHVLTVVLSDVHGSSLIGRWIVVVLFSAILAALMSTADSVLLSLSSMVTKDFVAVARPEWSQRRLTHVGKVCSWIVIAIAVAVAIQLRETRLVTLLKIKFELLTQLAPAFFLGLHWQRAKASPILLGMLVGLATALFLVFTGNDKPYGIHAGLYGMVVNLVVALVGSAILPQRAD